MMMSKRFKPFTLRLFLLYGRIDGQGEEHAFTFEPPIVQRGLSLIAPT